MCIGNGVRNSRTPPLKNPVVVLLAFLTLTYQPHPGGAIYFPGPKGYTLTLTSDIWHFPIPLVYLEPDDGNGNNVNDSRISFKVENQHPNPRYCPQLQIDSATDSIIIKRTNWGDNNNNLIEESSNINGSLRRIGKLTRKDECVYQLIAELGEGKPGARNSKGKDEITIKLRYRNGSGGGDGPGGCGQLSPALICSNGVEGGFHLSLHENSKDPLPLYKFGIINQLCPHYRLNYTISSEDNALSITQKGNFFELWSQKTFDREKADLFQFNVTCNLNKTGVGTPISTTIIPGTLTILDQNDNAPYLQLHDGGGGVGGGNQNTFLNYSYTMEEIKKHGGRIDVGSHLSLVANDRDTVGVNHFRMVLGNDSMGILRGSVSSFPVPKGHLGIRTVSTGVYPNLFWSDQASHLMYWPANKSYCVEAELKDDSQVVPSTPVKYMICLSARGNQSHPSLPPRLLDEHNLQPIIFDKEGNNLTNVNNTTFFSGDGNGIIDDNEERVNNEFSGKLVEGKVCGTNCILWYVGLFLVITLLIALVTLASWRRIRGPKRKSVQSSSSSSSPDSGVEMGNLGGGGPGGRGGESGILLPDDVEYGIGFPANALLITDNLFQQVESKWEIPREDLHLDYVLGEGEFGRVLKGILRLNNGMAHVAVKMLKVDGMEGGHKSIRQEFMAEFSLLKQLDHSNVIKLFGACTTSRGPPLLIMEYAEYGSLRSFLRKCRRIEKIGEDEGHPHQHHHSSSHHHHPHLQKMRVPGDIPLSEYYVTPQEVLGFSWQIAKGMAYLSDMKMVHRDLAARNVLLTKQRMCKISDFGLTRDIYVDDAYKKKSKDRVPVKWLAPECLTDELYTSKSDVWAFGVLLWELTTLGASPYPGIQMEMLYTLLDSGYRMPQPFNCSNEVYAIMQKCWSKAPTDRPTFHELVFELSRLLEDGIEYLKLDIPPTVSNPGYDLFSHYEIPLTASTGNRSPPVATTVV